MKKAALIALFLAAAAALAACAPAVSQPADDWYSDMFGKALTLQEAKDDPDFGDYIILPSDELAFESANRVKTDSQDELAARFSKGEVFLNLRITKMREEYSNRLADTDIPESYDLSRYDDPFGPYTPAEYFATLDNPIFEAPEITQEIILAREGKSGAEQYEFGVLLGGVLIEISSGGIAADDLLAAITDMPANVQK